MRSSHSDTLTNALEFGPRSHALSLIERLLDTSCIVGKDAALDHELHVAIAERGRALIAVRSDAEHGLGVGILEVGSHGDGIVVPGHRFKHLRVHDKRRRGREGKGKKGKIVGVRFVKQE